MSQFDDSRVPNPEDLLRELQALREENESLLREARRFRALIGSTTLCVSLASAAGRPLMCSPGWETLWKIPREPFIKSEYCLLEDRQVIESGAIQWLNRAFLHGEEVVQPPIVYDPNKTEGVETGNPHAWVISISIPILDENKRVLEVLMVHYASADAAELQKKYEASFASQAELEASLRAKNDELEAQIAQIEEQRRAIQALSAPVLRVNEGVLVLPVVGLVDDQRGARILETLLHAVVVHHASHVIVDVTGIAAMDEGAADHLCRMARATRLIGAECILAGISPTVAGTLVGLGVSLGDVQTSATLADALATCLGSRGRRSARY